MKKKFLTMLAAAFAVCGTAGVLSACGDDEPTPEPPKPDQQQFNQGDKFIDELEGEFTYDEDGNLVQEKYTAKKYNMKYLVSDGAYITLSGNKPTELVIDGYKGDIQKLSVADIENNIVVDNAYVSIVGIKERAFYGCESLEEVDLTKTNLSLTFAVGSGAFANCIRLTKVTMPEFIYTKSLAIGSGAFMNDVALGEVALGDKLVDLGAYTFANCVSLTSISIPQGVTTIEPYTFADCDAFASLSLASGARLKAIGNSAFSGTSLSALDLSAMNELTYIGSSAFNGTKLSTVTLPDSVTYIGSRAFYDCEELTTVNVPFLGNSIAESATFNSIYGMSDKDTREISVTAKMAISVPDSSFEGVENIKSLTLNSFTAPGTYKIYDGDGVSFNRELVRESRVDKRIGQRAFKGCSKLATVALPADTEAIAARAFDGCTSLTSFTIPSKVKSIGDLAFKECSSFANIVLPASLKTIGNGAFAACKSVTSITIPETVISVGSSALVLCPKLTTVTVGRLNGLEARLNDNDAIVGYDFVSLDNVTSWFGYDWLGQQFGSAQMEAEFPTITSESDVRLNLETVNVSSLYTLKANTFESLTTVKNVSLTFKDIDNTLFEDGKYDVPGLPDTKIGSNAFYGCTSLVGVTLTDADSLIGTIGSSAFEDCRSLSSFTVPAAVKKIESGAFRGVSSMSSFTVPATVESVENSVFAKSGVRNLTVEGYNKVVPPRNNTFEFKTQDVYLSHGNIGNWFDVSSDSSFYIDTLTLKNVNNLVSNALSGWHIGTLNLEFVGTMSIGASRNPEIHYTTIGSSALKDSSVSNLNITGGDKVKIIGSSAFENLNKVNSDIFAKFSNVVSIGSMAFSGNPIATITLPGSLERIGYNAFYNCSNVSTLNIGNYASLEGKAVEEIFGADNSGYYDSFIYANSNYVPANLKTITVNGIDSLSDLSWGAFSNLKNVEAIALNLVTEDDYVILPSSTVSAFDGCEALQKVFVPDNITKIFLESGLSKGSVPCVIGSASASATIYVYSDTLVDYGNYWHNGEETPEVNTEYASNTYTFNIGDSETGWKVTATEGEAVVDKDDKQFTTTNGNALKESDIPAVNEWEGHVLVGWYSNSSFSGEPVTFPYYSNYNTTLYARWKETAKSVSERTLTKFVEAEGATSASGTVSTNHVDGTDDDYATFVISVVKKSTVTLTARLDQAVDGGKLYVYKNNSSSAILAIDNDNWDSDDEDNNEYYETTSAKTVEVVLNAGGSLKVEYYRGYVGSYQGSASVSYSVVDYVEPEPVITVTAPTIPAANIPELDVSGIDAVKGVEINNKLSFANYMNTLKNLSESEGFTAGITLPNGSVVVEEYDYSRDNAVLKQTVTTNGETQTVYYTERYGAGSSLDVYFNLTDSQLEQLAAGSSSSAVLVELMRGKWLKETMNGQLRIDSGLSVVDTDIGNYTFDREKGVYWKVINEGSFGKVVLALSVESDGKAHYYLSFYRYNELWMVATYDKINDTAVSIPDEVFNNLFDMENPSFPY